MLTSPRLADLNRRVLAEVDSAGSLQALHAAALLDLTWADAERISLQRSISFLESAARMAEHPAPVLVDLAAAYLIRAERMQNARDLLAAMEAAGEALRLQPGDPVASFNLALALQSYGLMDEARGAWGDYLMVDSTSGWADEARKHARQLGDAPVPALPPKVGATAVEVAAWAGRNPQDARLLGWDDVLGGWGAAVLAADSGLAGQRLDLAGALGDALERRGGDATLADAVRSIRARTDDRAATLALARAHRSYAQGRSAYLDLEYALARARFAEVIAARPPSASLEMWAKTFHAAAVAYLASDWAGGELAFRRLVSRTDTLRYPALAGAVQWNLTTSLLRGGKYEMALTASQEAARSFRRAGEHEHVGGTGYLTAEAEFGLGAVVTAHATTHRTLARLRPYRRSVWLCNLLSAAARTAEADGLVRAAILLQDERVTAAERTGHPAYLAEALLGRAQVLTTAGELTRARADIETGEARVRGLQGYARGWLNTNLWLTRGGVLASTDPPRAVAVLDTAIAALGRTPTSLRLLAALVGRAQARLTLGDVPGTKADLEHATAILVERRRTVARVQLQASLLDAARGVFDQIALLELQEGDTTAALGYLEQARVSFSAAAPEPPERARERWRVPRGSVVVEYVPIGDTLLIWTVADTTVRLTRATVDRRELARTIEHVRSSLERRSGGAAVLPELAALYDRLVRPVRGRVEKGAELVVVADGEIAGIPFAALYDSARQRYLMQDHPLRLAASLRDASLVPEAGKPSAPRALLVADPAFDARAYPTLPRLPEAAAESDSIAAVYPGAAVLADSAAHRSALKVALRRVDIAHFAGHAVFDDDRPEQSYLVLAPERGSPDPGRLTAADLAAMDLSHLRLVVLSACQTLRSGSGRSGGFAGFAGAVLGAGADGVVGGLWRVDDELTRPLMTAFHRAYRESGNAPRALQAAQLQMLRSSDPALLSPAAWAAFRYAGH